MQDRPTSRELLASVAHLLDDDVLPALSGPLAYHVRVAANLVRIVEREQSLGSAHLLRERQMLCRVLELDPEDLVPGTLVDQVADLNQQLASDLEDNIIPRGAEARVREVLLQVVKDKLAVVRPGYDGYDGGVEIP